MSDVDIRTAIDSLPDTADYSSVPAPYQPDPFQAPQPIDFDLPIPPGPGHDPFAPTWAEAPQSPPDVLSTLQDLAIQHPEETQRAIRQMSNDFARAAVNFGLSPRVAMFAAGWLQKNALRRPSGEAKWHDYNVDLSRLSPLDRPHAAGFLNAAFKAGIPASDVDALIGAYQAFLRNQQKQARDRQATAVANAQASARLDSRTAKEIEQQDARDKQRCEVAARSAWGHEFGLNVALINDYLDKLPKPEREFFETAEMQDGSLALNDFDVLQKLLSLASDSGLTRAELEEMLRTNRRKYLSDPIYAAHLRSFLAGTAATPGRPAGNASAAGRIAEIEHIMRTDRRRYNRDEQLQNELRTLYAQRGK